MTNIFEDILSAIPHFSLPTNPEAEDPDAIKLIKVNMCETHKIKEAYAKFSHLIISIYAALSYAQLGQDAESFIPMIVELLPEDRSKLKILKNKTTLLYQHYAHREDCSEKKYNALALFQAIAVKYKNPGTNFQNEAGRIQALLAALSQESKNDEAGLKLKKEKSSLEKLDQACQPLKKVLENIKDRIDKEADMAIEPQKKEIRSLEEQLKRLVKNEKDKLTSQMTSFQEQVLKQAEYKNKRSFFFRQSCFDQGNLMSAMFADLISRIELFENRQISYAELMTQIYELHQAFTKKDNKTEPSTNSLPLTISTLKGLSHTLFLLKDEILNIEKNIKQTEIQIEETEKLIRTNKTKIELRAVKEKASESETCLSNAAPVMAMMR